MQESRRVDAHLLDNRGLRRRGCESVDGTTPNGGRMARNASSIDIASPSWWFLKLSDERRCRVRSNSCTVVLSVGILLATIQLSRSTPREASISKDLISLNNGRNLCFCATNYYDEGPVSVQSGEHQPSVVSHRS